MYNMDKAAELHKNIRQMMGELKHEYDCLYDYLMSKPDADEAYKKGLDEAWELARRLVWKSSINNLIEMGFLERGETQCEAKALDKFTASQALAKLRNYEARKKAEDEAVKVGDEVITDLGTRFVVTFMWDNGRRYAGYDSDGKHCGFERAQCRKTGRRFPEIAAVLQQMKGE